MQKKTAIIALLLALLWSCATTNQVRLNFVKTWEGKTADDLITEFGQPGQELPDGQGGRMLLYGGSRTFSLADFQRQGSYFRGHDLDAIFWVNSQGVIYRVWTGRSGRL